MGVACDDSTSLACRQISLSCVALITRQLQGRYNKHFMKVVHLTLQQKAITLCLL